MGSTRIDDFITALSHSKGNLLSYIAIMTIFVTNNNIAIIIVAAIATIAATINTIIITITITIYITITITITTLHPPAHETRRPPID